MGPEFWNPHTLVLRLQKIRTMSLPQTNTIHTSLEEAESAVQSYARQHGFVAVRLRSKKNSNGIFHKVWLCCIRGGKHKNWRLYLTEDTRSKLTRTRKTSCPWLALLKRGPGDDATWTINITDDTHNHETSLDDLSSFPSVRQMTTEESHLLKDMSKAGSTPRVILSTLRLRNPDSLLVSDDVYNARKKIRMQELNGRTPIEALLDEFEVNNVRNALKRDEEERITHLFFAFPTAVELLQEFPGVLLMDSTYKTNR